MRRREINISSVVIYGLIALGIIGIISSIKNPSSENEEKEIWVLSKRAVETNLKSPSTAKFPSLKSENVKINIEGDIYKVNSYVDAENSFGATLRNNFEVVLYKNGDTYTIGSVNIE